MDTLQELMKLAAPAATYDPAAFIVTADQIDAMIDQAEDKYNYWVDRIREEADPEERKNIRDSINYFSGKIAALKDVRHAAYVNGGYLQE